MSDSVFGDVMDSIGNSQIVKDISSIGVKDLMSIYGQINQTNIDKGFANTANYAAELKAQEGLLRLKSQIDNDNLIAQASLASLTSGTGDNAKYLQYLLIAGVVGVVVYMAVK